jgi:hypothetical protein
MAIPPSGTISIQQLQTEFGGTNPISLSEYYRNGAYVTANNTGVPTSGASRLSAFRGTVRQFAFTISGNHDRANLRSLAVSAGWNQSDFLNVTIDANANISSSTTATAAFTINGSYPNGIEVTNNGYIVGMGGNGGNMDNAGLPGGPALAVSSAVSIRNTGVIAGGGGGGGAGYTWGWNGLNRSSPGSGGSGLPGWSGPGYASVGPNSRGLYAAGGASYNWGWGGRMSSPGGIGGAWGTAGDNGGTVDGVYNYTGYAGGAGGAAVTGNGNVTWLATGTRYGALV